jgi:hypothetical protein
MVALSNFHRGAEANEVVANERHAADGRTIADGLLRNSADGQIESLRNMETNGHDGLSATRILVLRSAIVDFPSAPASL